jgi:CubicO group peptidase (beta-lactamase class C family)
MAKTVIGLLIGIAVKDGAIRSVDDPAEVYVPGLKGSEYGRTPIKALLQMASGVTFSEVYTDLDPAGSLAAVKRFNSRYAPPGRQFSYSSAESLVLGLVLAGATSRSVADYASEKLWAPLGAEADATWITDATGQEITFAYMNAVLRDWARLGLMLAHDGTWQGKSIIPRDWLLASTTIEKIRRFGLPPTGLGCMRRDTATKSGF